MLWRAACDSRFSLPCSHSSWSTQGITSTQKPHHVLNQTPTHASEIKMFQKSSVHPRRMPKNAMLFLEYLLDYENSHMQMGIKPHTRTITLNSVYIDFFTSYYLLLQKRLIWGNHLLHQNVRKITLRWTRYCQQVVSMCRNCRTMKKLFKQQQHKRKFIITLPSPWTNTAGDYLKKKCSSHHTMYKSTMNLFKLRLGRETIQWENRFKGTQKVKY